MTPWSRLAWFLVILMAAGVRFFNVDRQILIGDEWHALALVQEQGFGYIFSHFGQADHSIPVALYYELISRTVGLSEMAMRLPFLFSGIVLTVWFPYLMRHWLGPGERLLTGALLAISPLLIFYSRFARPYALLALLVNTAIILAWLWWKNGRRRHAAGWSVCAVFAAWLNPLTLVLSFAPFAWFGIAGLHIGWKKGNWQAFLALRLPLTVTLLLVIALLYVPVSNDINALLTKGGQHFPTWNTLTGFFSLYSGSGSVSIVVAMVALTLAGGFILHARHRDFTRFIIFVSGLAVVVVVSTGAAWIKNPSVPARYLVGLLPFFLAFAAIGMFALAARVSKMTGGAWGIKATVNSVFLLALALLGPLPEWKMLDSQFVHHASNTFDFRREKNPYVTLLRDHSVDDFYAEIARQHPDRSTTVVEVPFLYQSYANVLNLHENAHRQKVKIGMVSGVCGQYFKGEIDPAVKGIELKHFIRLDDLFSQREFDGYLVLRNIEGPASKQLKMDYGDCLEQATERYGVPWRRSANAVVFRIQP